MRYRIFFFFFFFKQKTAYEIYQCDWSSDVCSSDLEHKQFIDVINKAIATKEHNDNPEELKEVLHRITMYAITHFSTEENYMIEFNYPEYQCHKEEHHDFSKKAIEYCERVIDGDSQFADEIFMCCC